MVLDWCSDGSDLTYKSQLRPLPRRRRPDLLSRRPSEGLICGGWRAGSSLPVPDGGASPFTPCNGLTPCSLDRFKQHIKPANSVFLSHQTSTSPKTSTNQHQKRTNEQAQYSIIHKHIMTLDADLLRFKFVVISIIKRESKNDLNIFT